MSWHLYRFQTAEACSCGFDLQSSCSSYTPKRETTHTHGPSGGFACFVFVHDAAFTRPQSYLFRSQKIGEIYPLPISKTSFDFVISEAQKHSHSPTSLLAFYQLISKRCFKVWHLAVKHPPLLQIIHVPPPQSIYLSSYLPSAGFFFYKIPAHNPCPP